MTSMARSVGDSGALFDMAGTWPIRSTILQDIYFQEAGSPMDLTGLDFKLTLRFSAEDDSPTYTLSIDSGELAITTDDNAVPILRIVVEPNVFSETGDFVADLASEDVAGVVTHWAHGTITLRPNPVTF